MTFILPVKKLSSAILFLGTLFTFSSAMAIDIHGNQVINTVKNYSNTHLDMTDGRFTIATGGILNILNSTIDITISATNPFFINLMNGKINLNNNIITVKSSSITQTPSTKALYELIKVVSGEVILLKNDFKVDTAYTVGLFETGNTNATNGFVFDSNKIENFHGGIYLYQANNSKITGNIFTDVSFSNIYHNGSLSNITGNIFNFPGNLRFGNALDIVDSDSLTVKDNIISSGSNEGITITGGNNIFIDDNKITDCRSYGIKINSPVMAEIRKNQSLLPFITAKKFNTKMRFGSNSNILISNNYIALNRYGLTANMVSDLIVTKNHFIQKFSDSSIRQYWTNNDNLLMGVSNLTWLDNFYKEAFTQENGGDNTPALKFVEFPAHGGVVIE